tara:strand:- start:993 stop:1280 length:288 start_codon:yes stop_codon:yes gene_type:complete
MKLWPSRLRGPSSLYLSYFQAWTLFPEQVDKGLFKGRDSNKSTEFAIQPVNFGFEGLNSFGCGHRPCHSFRFSIIQVFRLDALDSLLRQIGYQFF